MRISTSLALLLTACGSVAASHDAGDDDVQADAMPGEVADAQLGGPDAMTDGVVDVQVFDYSGNKVQGAAVAVEAPSGAPKTRTLTDSGGHATVTVHTGDQITVLIDGGDQGLHRFTYVEVEPGDHLQVGRGIQGTGGQVGAMQLSTTLFNGASSYAFDLGSYNFGGFPSISNGQATSQQFTLYSPPYQPSSAVDAVAYALDFAGQPIAFRLGTANTSFSFFSFANNWRQDFLKINLKIDSTPLDEQVGIDGVLDTQQLHNMYLPYATSGGAVDVTLTTVPEVGRALIYGYTLRQYSGNEGVTRRTIQGLRDAPPYDTVQQGQSNVLTHTFQADDLLPEIGQVSVSGSNVPVISITSRLGGPLEGDVGIVSLYWYDGRLSNYWTFIVPPTTTQLEAPILPDEDARFLPQGGVSPGFNGAVWVEASALAGFGDGRRLPLPYYLFYSLSELAGSLPGEVEWTGGMTMLRPGD